MFLGAVDAEEAVVFGASLQERTNVAAISSKEKTFIIVGFGLQYQKLTKNNVFVRKCLTPIISFDT